MAVNFSLYIQSQATSSGDFTSSGSNLSLQRRDYEFDYGWRTMTSLQTMEAGLSPVDTADFNGDGVLDLLSISSSGSALYGHIGAAVSSTNLLTASFGSSNKIADLAAFGPFTSNAAYGGHGDLVAAGGEDIITISSVGGSAGTVNISSYNAGTGKFSAVESKTYDAGTWSFIGAANVDQTSSRDELLFYAEKTGELAVWKISDAGKFESGYIAGSVSDKNWRPVAVGDIDKDAAKDDEIFWVNGKTGQVAYWDTDANGHFSSGGVLGTLGSKNWKLSEVRDLDGDGDADILFVNPTDGLIGGWRMTSSRVTETKLLGTIETTSYASTAPIDGNTPTFQNKIDYVF